jgi:hypothetical protein
MKTLFNYTFYFCFFIFLTGCEEEKPLVKISKNERTWIPYTPNQVIQFQNEKMEVVSLQANIQNSEISQGGKNPSSILSQEQVALTLNTLAPHRNSLAIALRPTKIYIGASINDAGTNAEAVIENGLTGYNLTEDKFTYYVYVPEITLNGELYKNVFYRAGHPDISGYGYFPEYYYAKGQGLIAFKLENKTDWYYLK